jgi:hypothetical protein
VRSWGDSDIVRDTRESGDDPTALARTLDRIAAHAGRIEGIRELDVTPGDWVIIKTRNSTYVLAALGSGHFRVTGGWFAASGLDHSNVRILGCTWGGSVIHTQLIAAPGMCVEFDNSVRTSRILEVCLFRDGGGKPH